ncbi:MAG: hypothetical protein V3V15_06640 [Sphingorhabdus sp.]
MNRLVFTSKILLMLSGASIFAGSAAAQTFPPGGGGGGFGGSSGATNTSPKGEETAISPGGVDLRTGRFAQSITDISVGEDNESGGVALTRLLATNIRGGIRPFANFSHGWDITIIERRIDINNPSTDPFATGPDYQMRVNFGSRGETFQAFQSGNYQQETRTTYADLTFTGTKTNAVYTMRAGDGTLAVFRPITSNDCSDQLRCAYVSQVTWPDETRFDFEYESPSGANNMTRLKSVTSSRGYALLLEYAGTGASWKHVTKACVLNMAVTPKPTSNVCPAAALAVSIYGYTNMSGRQMLASATNAVGETTSYTYTNVSGPSGLYGAYSYKMGFKKPGQSASWLTNTVGETLNQSGELEE